MGFLSDIFNTIFADIITPNGGDRYIMYTLFRDDKERRRRQHQREKEQAEYDKQHQQFLQEIDKLEMSSVQARRDYVSATKKLNEANEKLRKINLAYVGCETFEEMCEKLDLTTAEKWKKFVDALPQYEYFNDEHKMYLMSHRQQ